jgi:hypothetical protein
MKGLNMHGIVRGLIAALHPEVPAMLYQSIGQKTEAGGKVKSLYAPGRPVTVQAQTESPAELFHAGRVNQCGHSRKFYLHSGDCPAAKVQGGFRPLSRNGDMLRLEDGSWWLVDGMIEDFTRSGWACVRATLQVNPKGIVDAS